MVNGLFHIEHRLSVRVMQFVLVSIAVLLLSALSVLPLLADTNVSSLQTVRRLFPSEWKVTRPISIAYSDRFNLYYLVDRSSAAPATRTRVLVLTPFEDLVGTVDLNFVMDDAVNFAYDNDADRLLMLNINQAMLAQVDVDGNGAPIPSSLNSVSTASLSLTGAQGITVDAARRRLLILNAFTQEVVSVALNANLTLPASTLERMDLTFLAAGDLRGLAIHPLNYHLFTSSRAQQNLYELTPSAQVVTTYPLASLGMTDPQGMTFGRSADLTDDPLLYNLLMTDTRSPVASAAVLPSLLNLANRIYLPLAHTQDQVQNQINAAVQNEAQLNGELVEVVLQPALCNNLWAANVQQTVSARIATGSADVEEQPSGAVRIASSTLDLGEEGTGPQAVLQIIGLRFNNLSIPRGATITNAYLEFSSDRLESLPTTLIFRGDARGQAPAFQAISRNVSTRPRTSARLDWSNIPPWQVGVSYRTPNLAVVIQEVVGQGDWNTGNALVLIVEGAGTRVARSYEKDPANAPLLVVEYTPAANTAIFPTLETQPVPHAADAADDAAFWVHPTKPELSTIIGTDKKGGLAVYDMNGHEIQYIAQGRINNVDIRPGFPLNGQSVALVAASNTSSDSIDLYKIDAKTRLLKKVNARPIQSSPALAANGICMYHSTQTGKYYALINDKLGNVEQWELFDAGNGMVDGVRVRNFGMGIQVEGCVFDDELSRLYISAEHVGIWKFGAEPGDSNTGTIIDHSDGTGYLTADVEGLAVYYAANNRGYLLASSQGSSSFVIYDRVSNDYLQTFQIEATQCFDKVGVTDGIDVINLPLGPAFPQGAFIAQDGGNQGKNQNFKVVSWQQIANKGASPLIVDTTYRH